MFPEDKKQGFLTLFDLSCRNIFLHDSCWILGKLSLNKILQKHSNGKPWWRHQMESFSTLLALCAGNSLVSVNSPHKGQSRGALMFSLICSWINDWVNNREAGEMRRHPGHYDVNVMHHWFWVKLRPHYSDVIMTTMASPINSLIIVCSTIYSSTDKNKTSKLHVTGLSEGNSPVTGEFPTQRASNSENVSIWWCHHEICQKQSIFFNLLWSISFNY